MLIHAYFEKNVPDLKTPRPEAETGAHPLGIRSEGALLSGLLGTRRNLPPCATHSPPTRTHYPESAASAHPGIGASLQPDPLLTAQHAHVGRRETCHPALRTHLSLPPLPDPYEQRRRSAERWQKERP